MAVSCSIQLAFAESGTEILYIDEEANFMLVDQVPNDIKEGDSICVFHAAFTKPNCEATVRWISKKPLIFMRNAFLAKTQVSDTIDVKRIYLIDKKDEGNGFKDASNYNRSYLNKKQGIDRNEQLQKSQTEQPKIPKGQAPSLQVDVPAIGEGDFPEIFIPKIHKIRTHSKKDTSETAETIAAIKRALKDKAPSSYQFMPTRAEDVSLTQKIQAEDIEASEAIAPSPLHQAIDYSVFQILPVLPSASFQTLRFRTIKSDSLEQNSLWTKTNTNLKPIFGTGFSLNLMQNMSRLISFGWRYHIYEKASSRATYDEIESRFEAVTSTRISTQAVHGAFGWRQHLGDYLSMDNTLGLDLFYTELWFKAVNFDNSSSRAEAIGFAQSNFFFFAPRWQSSLRLQYRGWSFMLSSIITTPLISFNKKFDGSAAAPSRLIYNQDPEQDLKKSLIHKIRPIGAEFLIGFTYQPQRE